MLALLSAIAGAQDSARDYPTKPIRFLVPYPPAGGTDIVARTLTEPLSQVLGQPIIIDNRGGAAGNLGTDLAAKAPADGYTVLFTLSSHTINPRLYDKLPFDVEKDFVPVSLAAMIPQILVAHPSVPVNNVKELIALARSQPGKLKYASVGTGSPGHIAGELFKLKTGIDMVHVPYKGTQVQELAAGRLDMAIQVSTSAMPLIKAGRVRVLAVTSAKRDPSFPDVPAVDEIVPGYEVTSWLGLAAPSRTSQAIVERLSAEVRAALAREDVAARIRATGAEPFAMTSAEFRARVEADILKWRRLAAKISLQ